MLMKDVTAWGALRRRPLLAESRSDKAPYWPDAPRRAGSGWVSSAGWVGQVGIVLGSAGLEVRVEPVASTRADAKSSQDSGWVEEETRQPGGQPGSRNDCRRPRAARDTAGSDRVTNDRCMVGEGIEESIETQRRDSEDRPPGVPGRDR